MRNRELEKTYNPLKVEEKWYAFWEELNLFHADADTDKNTYTIVIPPPNVTGMLTMGHILNNTIQDFLIRWKKMKGFETLWMPGTDHAGIATQSKVEAALFRENKSKYDLGREKFLQRVWEWKERYGGIILQQLRKLGAACDWQRECFTMDETRSQAVRETFVRLYEKGLIYKGRRLINWSPKANTALSEEEVNYADEPGKFYSIAYPLKEGKGEVVVATTRPETMLGDTAVAVHPEDPRYKSLVGKMVILPLMNREIPIIADEHADPEKGSGAVKITPAHDFNDFEVGIRHDLEAISVIDQDASMNENAETYQGLNRFDARERIVDDLQKLGLLRKVETIVIPVPRCYRTHDIIEPLLSEQWFVKMKPLAEPAIQAVRQGEIRFYPRHWEETYFHWMENIRDWCISRQIWWGHRIPAWTCDNGHLTISRTDPAECSTCGSKILQQDKDVLDTWFSSWLWPFSTLGWPEKSKALSVFFPTDTLVTGPDIIFFWVARMIMASYEFMGDLPFKDVYFNGMIRDKDNRKMSKSLGNSPDPLWLIEGADKAAVGEFAEENPSYKEGVPAYGADAVRLTMAYLTPLGGDIRFDHTLVEMGQKFCNKLWNAARFVLMNLDADHTQLQLDEINSDELEVADRWITSRLHSTIAEMETYLNQFRFNDALHALYDFTWSEFCDWYIELAKIRLYEANTEHQKHIAQSFLVHMLDAIVRLLHPITPFITEEIWQNLPTSPQSSADSVMLQPYPSSREALVDTKVEREMQLIQQVISAVRNIRSEMGIPPNKEASLIINCTNENKSSILKANTAYLKRLARLHQIEYQNEKPQQCVTAVVQGIELYVPLAGLVDVQKEKSRLEKEISRLSSQLQGLSKKLGNENFLSRAPQSVVEKEKMKKTDFEENLKKLQQNLEMLQ
ncbi:valine--tRNA ligase [candidate division KSB1 bacterium]|nr:valine--tRNA ligase [candidate division KSB1 bacterium]